MLKSLTPLLTPNNEGALVRFMVWLFGVDWKTSASGFLSFLIATFASLTPFLVMLSTIMPNKWPIGLPLTTAAVTTLAGTFKAWIGFISKDSGTQAITVPNLPDPIGVPSHELPNQPPPPGSKIVKE
jgi:hypothetical protein